MSHPKPSSNRLRKLKLKPKPKRSHLTPIAASSSSLMGTFQHLLHSIPFHSYMIPAEETQENRAAAATAAEAHPQRLEEAISMKPSTATASSAPNWLRRWWKSNLADPLILILRRLVSNPSVFASLNCLPSVGAILPRSVVNNHDRTKRKFPSHRCHSLLLIISIIRDRVDHV